MTTVIGFRFRLQWAATGYVLIENGRSFEHAEGKVKRFAARRGAGACGMSEQKKPKRAAMPVFVVLKDSISTKDIRRMERLAHICVVESSAPQSARFLDTPPTSDIQAQASAAERQERARPMKQEAREGNYILDSLGSFGP